MTIKCLVSSTDLFWLFCVANGRAAMVGFTSIALTELSAHTPALEQIGQTVPAIILVSLTLTFATIVPKLVSGSSLKDLHEVRCASS